ncbi:ABC transporter substrate-binding protein (plasmid) [Tistrella mobilis]|uniref:ABC transporter substrate-binding protein n=1 Tax=Tistrella mobilis TaxID=171437 RepID=UPI002613CF4A|nr:ABC transporter substrate-binding protein [uncultured Tistrella sp.]
MSADLTRRKLLVAAGAALALSAGGRVRAATPERLAVIDWALLETVLALGIQPVAAAELRQFRETVVEPPVPRGVADLGLRGAINFELLRLAAPDLILNSAFHAWADPNLARIAPVETMSIHRPGVAPYGVAAAAARSLGARLGRGDAAAALIADTDAVIAAAGTAARAASGGRPVFLVTPGDAAHVSAFGPDSLPGEVAARMGLANAWGAETRYSGTAPVGIEALAARPEAWIALMAPMPPDTLRRLGQAALWQALPAVREGRVLIIDPVNPFGALPTAARFARLLAAAMVPHG